MTQQVDPRLTTPTWRAIRAEWQRLQPTQCEATRCLLPGQPITYGPRCPTSLDVGHIEARNTDDRTQWLMIDTRPEHARCNRSQGATIRNSTKPVTLSYTDAQW